MLKSGLNNCWSTPIYKTSIDLDLASKLMGDIISIEDITNPTPNSLDNDLTERVPALKDIAIEKFTDYIAEAFHKDLNDYDYKLSAWLTGSAGGYSMDLHNHSGSPFVSVFYLMCEDQNSGGELVIQDPRTNANRGFLPEFQDHFKPLEFIPSTGDVVIMPGYLYHYVKVYKSSMRFAVPVDLQLMLK